MSVERKVKRLAAAAWTGVAACAAALAPIGPAQAQFFMKSHDISAPPVKGDEAGFIALPGATADEQRAGLLWHFRAAINVAALQCQFEPTLMSVDYYNDVLVDHKEELAKAYATLTKYFTRVNKTPKAGQTALDNFGTQVYSSFTTATPYMFCQTAGSVERDAVFTPRGQLYKVAEARMQEMRNALVPWGEQRFPRGHQFNGRVSLPAFDARCYKGATWNDKCGPYTFYER